MQDILQFLDNFVMQDSDSAFFDPTQLHTQGNIGVSRFNYGPNYCDFRPYNLTFKNIYRLEQKIRINDNCPFFDTMSFNNANKFLSHADNDSIILYRPREISGLLEDTGNRLCGNKYGTVVLKENKKHKRFIGDTQEVSPFITDETMYLFRKSITILGLLAIVCRSFFGNTEFRDYIVKFYLKPNFTFSRKYNLWILNSANCKAEKQDYSKIAAYLKLPVSQFYNDIVPYTFKWRDD